MRVLAELHGAQAIRARGNAVAGECNGGCADERLSVTEKWDRWRENNADIFA